MDKKDPKKIPEKFWFDVRMDCLIPATLHFRIQAENPEEALLLSRHKPPRSIAYEPQRRKALKVRIYEGGSCLLRLAKQLMGVW